jgi:hypothetical protein
MSRTFKQDTSLWYVLLFVGVLTCRVPRILAVRAKLVRTMNRDRSSLTLCSWWKSSVAAALSHPPATERSICDMGGCSVLWNVTAASVIDSLNAKCSKFYCKHR